MIRGFLDVRTFSLNPGDTGIYVPSLPPRGKIPFSPRQLFTDFGASLPIVSTIDGLHFLGAARSPFASMILIHPLFGTLPPGGAGDLRVLNDSGGVQSVTLGLGGYFRDCPRPALVPRYPGGVWTSSSGSVAIGGLATVTLIDTVAPQVKEGVIITNLLVASNSVTSTVTLNFYGSGFAMIQPLTLRSGWYSGNFPLHAFMEPGQRIVVTGTRSAGVSANINVGLHGYFPTGL